MDNFSIFFHLSGDGPFFEKSFTKINNIISENNLKKNIIYCYNGSIEKYSDIKKKLKNDDVIFLQNHCNYFECPTLNFLLNECKNYQNNKKILYIHTKGAYNYKSPVYDDWIDVMSYFTIKKFENCLYLLDTYAAVGVDFTNDPWPHFSGNFWWANSSHIKQLKALKTLNRYDCEKWICSLKNNYYNLFSSQINVLNNKGCDKKLYYV